MGISAAGFQNHIQNPLALVMAQIMNGAFDNARDARRIERDTKRDATAQRNMDVSRAIQLAMAGGRLDRSQFKDDPQAFESIGAAQGIGQMNEASRAEDRLRATQADNLRRAEAAQRMRLAGDDAALRRASVGSTIANTWADNVGSAAKYVGDKLFPDKSVEPERPRIHTDPIHGTMFQIITMPNGRMVRMPIPEANAPSVAPAPAPAPAAAAPPAAATGIPAAGFVASGDAKANRMAWHALAAQNPDEFKRQVLAIKQSDPKRYAVLQESLRYQDGE